MKKIGIVFLLFISIILFPACNSIEDVKHKSEKDMINYVKGAIGEDISLVSVDSNYDNSLMTYVFKLDDRNATFKATSVISALSIDGEQFGNYKENIYIKYEEGIAESEYYIAERLRIEEELNIKGKYKKIGLAIIYVDNYEDIDKVAQYALKLDELYAFNEKKPECMQHINLGAISFSDTESAIDGPKFSTNKKHRLRYKDVYNEIVKSYIIQLKKFGIYDNTIPDNIWRKYN